VFSDGIAPLLDGNMCRYLHVGAILPMFVPETI